ncbi:terpene cyclase [Neopestalotiopsis sp. 37M]|nr:terpene cyclase [Neopestalotiopsis sp. 37M]
MSSSDESVGPNIPSKTPSMASMSSLSSHDDTQEGDPKSTILRLPDLFSSIMSADAPVNPAYSEIKGEADAWAVNILKLQGNEAKRNARANLAYLSAISAPRANAAGVFAFDDIIDEGFLKDDTVGAAQTIIESLAVLDDTHPPVSAEQDPILLDQYMEYRRGCIGTYPAFAVVEWATGVDLPLYVMQHPSIIMCEIIATDIVIYGNDLLSLRKDMEHGVEHNLIIKLNQSGLSLQSAVDVVSEKLDDCYRQWYKSLAEIPIYGSPIDTQVLALLQGLLDVALGTLHWSFYTGRYLGDEGPEIKRTRLLKVTHSVAKQ